MPVGTIATVKALTTTEVKATGAQILLGNTFHLMLRPGADIIRAHGDLHDFMHWQGPILTDSGGFQVFSLTQLRKLSEEGVTFRSPIDGSMVHLTPESSIQMQKVLGSDIVMILDECTPYPADEEQARSSMELSLRWAKRCKMAHGDSPMLYLELFKAACIHIYAANLYKVYKRSGLMVMLSAVYQWENLKN